jgi:hypothetical protein
MTHNFIATTPSSFSEALLPAWAAVPRAVARQAPEPVLARQAPVRQEPVLARQAPVLVPGPMLAPAPMLVPLVPPVQAPRRTRTPVLPRPLPRPRERLSYHLRSPEAKRTPPAPGLPRAFPLWWARRRSAAAPGRTCSNRSAAAR